MTAPTEGIFDALSDKIGATSALRLIALFGGASLYVPDAASTEHPIGRAIGREPMEILCAVWGGQTIDLPQLDEFDRLRRVRKVARLLSACHSPSDIAKLLGISYRQVTNYRAQAEELLVLPLVFRSRGATLGKSEQQGPLNLTFLE